MSLPFPTLQNVSERFSYEQFDDFIGEGKFGNVYIAIDNEPTYLTPIRKDTIPHISSTIPFNDEAKNNTVQTNNNSNYYYFEPATSNQQQQQQQVRVALKVVDKSKLDNAKAYADIVNEVELARRVKHPNCVSVLDAVQTDDRIFIVQELVEGSDLQVLVAKQRGLPEPLVQSMAAQLLYALSCLHRQSVVHRDVKPENIMLSGSAIPVIGDDSRDVFDGTLQQDQYLDAAKMTLVDFGLAKSLPKSSHSSLHNNSNTHSGNINNNQSVTSANGQSNFSTTTTTTTTSKKRVVVGASSSINAQPTTATSMFTTTSTTTNRMSSVSRPTENGLNFNSSSMKGNGIANSPSVVVNYNDLNTSQTAKCEEDSASTPSCSQTTNNNNTTDIPSSPTIMLSQGNNYKPQQQSIGLFPLISNVDAAVQINNGNNNNNNGNNSMSSNSLIGGLLPRQTSLQSFPPSGTGGGGTNSPMVMTPCGTFGYSAPEMMRHLASLGMNQKQTTSRQEVYKRDIYSVGLVLYYAISGKTPFTVKTAAALAKQMETGPSFSGPQWDRVSQDGKNFIALLLTNLPEARPTADLALAHPWISGLVQKLKFKYSQLGVTVCGGGGSAYGSSGNNLLQHVSSNGNLGMMMMNNNSEDGSSSSTDFVVRRSNSTSSINCENASQQGLSSQNGTTATMGDNFSINSNNNNHNFASSGSLLARNSSATIARKNNGRSFEDLSALHELRASEARDFDFICSNANNNNADSNHDDNYYEDVVDADQVVVSDQDTMMFHEPTPPSGSMMFGNNNTTDHQFTDRNSLGISNNDGNSKKNHGDERVSED